MAEKSFGVKKIKLDGDGTPTIESPSGGNLNITAATTTASGNLSVGGNITVTGTVDGIGFLTQSNVNVTGDSGLSIKNGSRLGFDQTGTRSWTVKAASGNLVVASGDGSGALVATTFSGSGASLTSLPAGQLTGTIAAARLDTATTQSAGNNSTKIATTSYTDTAISNLVDSSPDALNTLNELAAALGDDANFSTTVTNSIATKLPLAGGTLTGALTGTSATFSGDITASTVSSTGALDLTSTNNGAIKLNYNSNQIFAIDGTGIVVDDDILPGTGDTYDIGSSGLKFNNLYLNGTITGSGANLTNLPAGQLTGTVADARISTLTASKLSGALPAISATNLTNIPAANITGTLPAIDGSNLTGITASAATKVNIQEKNAGWNQVVFCSQNSTGNQDLYIDTNDDHLKYDPNAARLYSVNYTGGSGGLGGSGLSHFSSTTINRDGMTVGADQSADSPEFLSSNYVRFDANTGNIKSTGICTASHFYGNGSNLTGISVGTADDLAAGCTGADLTLSGNLAVTGTQTFTGNTTASGDLGIAGGLAVIGQSSLIGTTTVSGELRANGGIKCDTDKFTVADATGNTSIAGTLNVTGISSFTSDITVINSGSPGFTLLDTSFDNREGTIKQDGGTLVFTAKSDQWSGDFDFFTRKQPMNGNNQDTSRFYISGDGKIGLGVNHGSDMPGSGWSSTAGPDIVMYKNDSGNGATKELYGCVGVDAVSGLVSIGAGMWKEQNGWGKANHWNPGAAIAFRGILNGNTNQNEKGDIEFWLGTQAGTSSGSSSWSATKHAFIGNDGGNIGLHLINGSGLTIKGTQNASAGFKMFADNGDDNEDKWQWLAKADGTMKLQHYAAGGWADVINCFTKTTNTQQQTAFQAGSNGIRFDVNVGTQGQGVTAADVWNSYNADGQLHRTDGNSYLSVDDYFTMRKSGGTTEQKQFVFRTDTGNAGADNNWNSNQNYDFAEMFEWSDGNPSGEDRIGHTVAIDGLTGKIKIAEDGDTVIGVVSGTAAFVGNSGSMKWQGANLRDEWGRLELELVKDADGNQLYSYPYMGNVRPKVSVKRNPDWDESQTYTPREDRKEWDTIGLLGQCYVRKTAVIPSTWIKLREIDSTKDFYLIK
tara:strand:+ start:1549 stop:4890 length:3342 start_codon:yes stop_codon:yes gene_type:complete